jgi:hypothetical protein
MLQCYLLKEEINFFALNSNYTLNNSMFFHDICQAA